MNANFDDFVARDVSSRPSLDEELYGIGALERLYACEDGWLFVYVPDDLSWQTLARWLDTNLLQRFPSRDAGLSDEESLASALEQAFLQISADHAETQLTPLGVGCVRADRSLPGVGLAHDPIFREAGLVVETQHPEYGLVLRHAPVVKLAEASDFGGPCLAGDRTRQVLSEFGAGADVQALLDEGAALALE